MWNYAIPNIASLRTSREVQATSCDASPLFSRHHLRNVSIQLHSPLPSYAYYRTPRINSAIRVKDGTSLSLSLSMQDSYVLVHFMPCLPRLTIKTFVLPYVSLDQQSLTPRTSCECCLDRAPWHTERRLCPRLAVLGKPRLS